MKKFKLDNFDEKLLDINEIETSVEKKYKRLYLESIYTLFQELSKCEFELSTDISLGTQELSLETNITSIVDDTLLRFISLIECKVFSLFGIVINYSDGGWLNITFPFCSDEFVYIIERFDLNISNKEKFSHFVKLLS